MSFNKSRQFENPIFTYITTVFVLHLTVLWKKEIKTSRNQEIKSISRFFGRHFRSDYAVLRSFCIDDCTRTPHAFIRLQPTRGHLIVTGSRASQTDQQGSPTTQSDRELNAVYLKHRHWSAKGAFSGSIWSPAERYLIGLDCRFTKWWLGFCSQ